jgi:hypothetical protein
MALPCVSGKFCEGRDWISAMDATFDHKQIQLRLWLGHSDARQVFDLPRRTSSDLAVYDRQTGS